MVELVATVYVFTGCIWALFRVNPDTWLDMVATAVLGAVAGFPCFVYWLIRRVVIRW